MIRKFWSALALVVLAGCNCGGEDIGTLNRPVVEFLSPAPHTLVDSEAEVVVKATARNRAGLEFLALRIGETEIGRCDATAGVGLIECEVTFVPGDYAEEFEEASTLVIVGEATAPGDRVGTEELPLFVRPASSSIVIVSPEEGSTVAPSDPVEFKATAESEVGLQTLELFVGSQKIATCDAGGEAAAECSEDFDIQNYGSEVRDGKITITAKTTNRRGYEHSESRTLPVSPIKVRFHLPAITLNNPPRAGVSGTSPLELRVVSTHPVTLVGVTYQGQDFERWNNPDLSQPIRRDIDWGSRLSTGEHLLVAHAVDELGNTDTAELLVNVSCRSDADCGGNTRCCVDTGTCHEMVGSGELCDCQNPCPFNEGCFPGTCGESPRRCRPGCYPGDRDTMADRCPPQQGFDGTFRPAHCEWLPANERTAENRGGACVPSDACSVVDQDCPDLPLDRTRPPGPDNPPVPHNCVPASPTTNKCIPAGRIAQGALGCGGGLCGEDGVELGCGEGNICVRLVDEFGEEIEPPRCRQQCSKDTDCPGLLPFLPGNCSKVMGAGSEEYATGACL